ncbi:nucleotide exchange factor GrpE [Megasphaera sp. SW808]|jgi:molecular chaperone GrpE|uniref:nucleotide exchange factor GrpE n=1 Tax=Megasphaera sp. SW808 TaxID=2530045 RepID=UPI00143B2404|nr:nucleotide exchange factor GrpE [Megasphaera sp. SW808]NJE35482.1 nucleotide exchange factor GrpE [Megasphaera sp. SW808]
MSKDKDKKREQQAAEEAAEAEKAEVNETAEAAPAADEEQAAEETASTDAKAEAAVAEMQQRYMRLQADFANFKKRTAGEKLQISEVVKMEVLQNVLPVVDNFERALQVPQDKLTDELKSFVDGYEMIYKQLMTVLEKEGVVKIDAVGKPFDPNYHQAVMRVASDEYDNDVVVEVLQEGYLLGDKTLRPAMVKVAFNG